MKEKQQQATPDTMPSRCVHSPHSIHTFVHIHYSVGTRHGLASPNGSLTKTLNSFHSIFTFDPGLYSHLSSSPLA